MCLEGAGDGPGRRPSVAAALFAIMAAAVVDSGSSTVTWLDEAVSGLVAPYRTRWLLAVFLWLTTFGTGAALLGVAVTATGFLWAACRRRSLPACPPCDARDCCGFATHGRHELVRCTKRLHRPARRARLRPAAPLRPCCFLDVSSLN
jgi:hypothetical protein